MLNGIERPWLTARSMSSLLTALSPRKQDSPRGIPRPRNSGFLVLKSFALYVSSKLTGLSSCSSKSGQGPNIIDGDFWHNFPRCRCISASRSEVSWINFLATLYQLRVGRGGKVVFSPLSLALIDIVFGISADFFTDARDNILSASLVDAFCDSGEGFGNTIPLVISSLSKTGF